MQVIPVSDPGVYMIVSPQFFFAPFDTYRTAKLQYLARPKTYHTYFLILNFPKTDLFIASSSKNGRQEALSPLGLDQHQ